MTRNANLQSRKPQSQGGISRRRNLYHFISTCVPSSHALSTNIYEIRPHGNENRYHYKIHPRKNGWLQNEPEWIQNSIKVITALQGAWTRFHNYCYHITTRCMEHPPLHLHYRLLATFKNCPNPFYMTCVHPVVEIGGDPRIRCGENHANTAPFCAKELDTTAILQGCAAELGLGGSYSS